jgi:SAM-dependent methyltransferase
VDAVTVGDAWHWFDPDGAAAEVHRVLTPGGHLILVWRAPRFSSYEGPVAERLRELRDDHPGFLGQQGREGIDRQGGFSDWSHLTMPFTHATDRDGLLALLASASFVATLPAAEREELLEQARDQIPDGPIEAEYDAEIWRATRTS